MNKFFNRPIAPHLTIYLLQQSSLFSIWHRISALILVTYITSYFIAQKFLFWTLFSQTMHIFFYSITFFSNPFFTFLILIVSFYHMLNGLRHILWDLGLFLSNKTLQNTNTIILFTILVLQILSYKKYFI